MAVVERKTKTINLRTTDTQYREIKDFAQFSGKSVSVLLLDAVREQMEDFEDVRDAERVLAAGEESYSWEDTQRIVGLL